MIVIVGPTCSGKTELGIILAKKLETEIISADSRQVFKYLNVGTAKSKESHRKSIKHHFIDLLQLDESFDASKFAVQSRKTISKLHTLGKVPVVVGGSGLFIKSLIDGILDEIPSYEAYRSELYDQRKRFGNEHIHNLLVEVDAESASKMLPQNWKRVVRALEVFHMTGKPIGYFHSNQVKKENFDFKQYGLEWERKILYENINRRVDEMIEHGLVEEAKSIIAMGYDKKLNSLNTVGYKEIISYLEGEISFDKAVELIKRNTRRFAKRQLTWFKADNRIEWLQVNSNEDLFNQGEKIFRTFIK